MQFQGTVLSTGTGFVAETPIGPAFITNRHNVTGRNNKTGKPLSKTAGVPDEIVIGHHSSARLGIWDGRGERLYMDDGKPRWLEHPVHGAKADMAALPLTNLSGVKLYPYELVDEPRIAVAPGDVVSVVGFPFGMSTGGLLPIWATGFVASEPNVKLNDSDLPIFYIDCRSRPGQSGSAVIAHRTGGMVTMEDGNAAVFNGPVTRLLGLYSGRVNSESDIGIVWKTIAISQLSESCGNGT
jgi:hypothetical protein